MTTQRSIEQLTRKQKGEENSCMDILSDNQANSLSRKLEHGLKGNLKKETKSLLIAAQNNAIRTNLVKAKIDKTQQNSNCR